MRKMIVCDDSQHAFGRTFLQVHVCYDSNRQ